MNMQMMLPMYDEYRNTKFIVHNIYSNVNTIGAINKNYFMYSRAYTIEFNDGMLHLYA